MRIAFVSQPLDVIVPPSMNSIGIWINEISRRLANDHDVLVYGRRGIAYRKSLGENIRTKYVYTIPNRWLTRFSSRMARYRDPKRPLFSSPLYYLEYILPIALDLRRQQVDVVHLQNFSQFVPIIRAINPNIKIALHMRCEWLNLLDYDMIDRRLKKTDLIFGVSDYITNNIRDRFPHHSDRCYTVNTGVDTDVFKPIEPSETLAKHHERNILFVGRITPEKGLHILLEAFRKVAPSFPDLHVNLVGSVGSLARDRLIGLTEKQQIRDLDVFYEAPSYLSRLEGILPDEMKSRVHYAGNVPHATTIDFYQDADILINPALSEPFGRSLIEANACGVPTIASRTDGMTELIEQGKNGILVEPGDVDDLAQAMTTLLSREDLRQRMGQAGRQFVMDHFSWEKIGSRLVALY